MGDPFEVMVTIADADSVFSPVYLAHVEAGFWGAPDGRRIIYNGPLNTYRNLGDASLLVQCLETVRCHNEMFHNPLKTPYPYSNYSLTMGFAAEIGFWAPDSMPEDIHTAHKAMVRNFGSITTLSIPPIICNDLVTGLCDRYTQAKRHQWGSVTEVAWQLSLLVDMKLSFHHWWTLFMSEARRGGSLVHLAASTGAFVYTLVTTALITVKWATLPPQVRFYMLLLAVGGAWRWVCFWIAEIILWRELLWQFPIKRPSAFNFVALAVFMPILNVVANLFYYALPTLHGLYIATFVGELAYAKAPKSSEVRELIADHRYQV